MTHIVIAEPQAIFRNCLSQCFNNEYEGRASQTSHVKCIAAFGDAKQAVDEALQRGADILLINMQIPGPSVGVEIKRAKSLNKRLRVVVYARSPEPEYIYTCRLFGVEGFVLTSASFEDFRNTIIKVQQGQIVYPLCDVKHMVEAAEKLAGVMTLTPRERAVFKYLAEGNSVKEIAIMMGLAAKTVEVHKFNVHKKLRLRNRGELISYAVRRKFVQLEPVEGKMPAVA